MFRAELTAKLKGIFGVAKVTFDEPGESYEQDCIFVQLLDTPKFNTGQGKATAKVVGAIVMYSERNKLPYGFFNRKIEQAEKALKEGFFFYQIDVDAANSPARLLNISERRTSFVYLYSAQYDPNQGEMTQVNF